MGDEIATIVTAVHDILKVNEDVPVTVEATKLGMAYAVPRGLEDSVVDQYSPWQQAEVKQVFYEQSSWVGSVLAEIQLIMSWRFNASCQYIVDVYLQKNIGSSPSRVGDFGQISYRVEHAGEDFQAQVLFVA